MHDSMDGRGSPRRELAIECVAWMEHSGIRGQAPLATVFPHFAALHAGYLWSIMQFKCRILDQNALK